MTFQLVVPPWLSAREVFIIATGDVPIDWQEDYLAETRDTVVLKGRQVGASTSGGVIAARRSIYIEDHLSAIVSPSLKQSTEVKDRAKSHLTALLDSPQLRSLGLTIVRDSSSLIELSNGSRILSLPGSAKSVRGWSAHLLILDEAAYIEPETFLAARATVAATGGRTIIQSTPEAPYGHFYDAWTDAQRDPSGRWASFSVTSEEAGTVSAAFLASERALLTDEKYAQEYLGRFTSPGLGLVDPDRLKRLTEETDSGPDNPWGRRP